MRRLMPALWLPVLAALLALWAMGCDYTGYGSEPLPEDGDESDGDVPDGDEPDGDEPQITGAGSCADPFIPASGQTTLTGSGQLADLENTVTGSSCLADDTTVATYNRVDGDVDDELEVEAEAEIDGDTELEAEVEVDGDTELEADAEVEVDGDTDAETDGEENLSCLNHPDCPVGYSCIASNSTCGLDAKAVACTDTSGCEPGYECTTMTDSTDKKCVPMEMPDGDLDDETTEGDLEAEGEIPEPLASGLGPEAIVKLALKVGDTVDISYTPEGYDALFYVLGMACEESAACLWPGNDVVNNAGVDETEMIQFVSTIEGVVFVALDSTSADATGSYTYTITITSDEGGTPPEAGKVGAACAEDKDCDTNYCLTSDVLKALLQTDIPIPNGYCSTVDLFVESCADECTEENGGFCIGGGFMGESYAIVNLCLRPCETNGDCRIEDEQICLDPQYWVNQGWITEETRTEFFGENKACLPTAFIAVMEEEMQLSSGN